MLKYNKDKEKYRGQATIAEHMHNQQTQQAQPIIINQSKTVAVAFMKVEQMLSNTIVLAIMRKIKRYFKLYKEIDRNQEYRINMIPEIFQ